MNEPQWVTEPTRKFYHFQTWFAMPFLGVGLWLLGASLGQLVFCLAIFFVLDRGLGHAAHGPRWKDEDGSPVPLASAARRVK